LENLFELLKNNPLFKGLGEDDIRAALNRANARKFTKKTDEYIFRVGDKTSSMGILLSGSVLVIQEDVWGRRNIMSRVHAGDVFAEIFAAAQDVAMNVSVVAETDCEILLINAEGLFASSQNGASGNAVVKNLFSLLAKKTMALNDKITHVSKRSTRDKLLSFLSAEAVKQGGLSFDIGYNRQQLADYLCVERAAMCVELSRLQSEGFLKYRKNHFTLTELAEV